MEHVLKIEHLGKTYGSQRALNDINLEINKGDIYGLVGRNGAGKTTLMKVITTLIRQSEGTVFLFGESLNGDYNNALSRSASIIESPTCYENLSAFDNLKYYCTLRGIKDATVIQETLEFVGLADVGKKKVKHFSLGMTQRLGLAIALIANPDFLILDEPINGLDPIAIMEFRDLLHRINTDYNTTILISSHILTELYQVSNRFGFIHNGTMIEQLTKDELDTACQDCLVVTTDHVSALAVLLDEARYNFKLFEKNVIRIYGNIDPAYINKLAYEHNLNILALYRESDNLEEYFKNLIQEVTQ